MLAASGRALTCTIAGVSRLISCCSCKKETCSLPNDEWALLVPVRSRWKCSVLSLVLLDTTQAQNAVVAVRHFSACSQPPSERSESTYGGVQTVAQASGTAARSPFG